MKPFVGFATAIVALRQKKEKGSADMMRLAPIAHSAPLPWFLGLTRSINPATNP
jgi:hypothetical protein